MATRFAVISGNWSSGGTWDNGSVPVSGDDVHTNGKTITIDQDINVGSLRNTTPPVYLPGMLIPKMISNSSPSGTVIANNNISTAYYVFDQLGPSTYWGSGAVSGWIGYTFTASTIITRYRWEKDTQGVSWYHPRIWTFEGSNDGFATAGVILDSQSYAANAGPSVFVSSGLTNTTGFTSYRLNVTASSNNQSLSIGTIEMTNNLGTNYGDAGGGSFTVPASLVGTRDITFNGGGMITNNSATIMTVAALSGSTVNFNVTSGGFIFNKLAQTVGANFTVFNITGNCKINFNSDLWGCQSTGNISNSIGIICVNAAPNITVNGNLYSSKGYSTFFNTLIVLNNSSTVLNINGDLIASDFTSATGSYIINAAAAGTVTNINGNLTGNIGTCYYSTAGSNLNISAGTITLTNQFSSPAIIMSSSSSLLTVKGPIINVGNASAILAYKMRFYSGQTAQWTVQDTTNANIVLSSISSSGITIGLPFSGDVRYLTTYGQNNEYVGSLIVPTIDNVRKGVQTDFTVGTADLTANDIFNAISGSSNSVAVRLRNVSTVQSAGDQIAGLS